MFRFKIVAAIVLVSSLLISVPAGAITYGVPDDGEHPYVGALAVEIDSEIDLICSGTLIAEDVFLTSAHCTDFIEAITGSARALVTFDDQFDPDGGTFYEGTMVTNPNYQPNRANDPGDIAVVLLDDAPGIATPVELPSAGLLDELNKKNGLRGQTFRNVGYGASEPHQGQGGVHFTFDGERRVSWSSFRNLQKAWLHMSQNPATSDSGTCFSDSGGPQFLGDSNTLVSITTAGDAICRATNTAYRVDTVSARAFLGEYVDLP